MERVVLGIGGHKLAVEGGSAVRFLRLYSGADPFLCADIDAEWTVRYGGDFVTNQYGDLLSSFVFSEIDSRCLFRRNGDEYLFEMIDGTTGSQLVAMRHRRGTALVEATDCVDPSALRFSLWFAYSMLAAPSGVTFVHSSVIVYQGKAVLFLGESGTGKSTHTRLWMNKIADAHLLNDDSPVLAIENGKPVVYGSPWSGKTPCYVARRFPLAAIVRLSQAPYNDIRSLKVPEAFAALQPSLPPALMQDEIYADLLIDIISSVLKTVPAYHLQCLPDADAARMSCRTIFGGV